MKSSSSGSNGLGLRAAAHSTPSVSAGGASSTTGSTIYNDELALHYFKEAIALIPPTECWAYDRALEVCTEQVLLQECHPLVFLRHAQYDPYAAARRMVEYWTLRYKTFGASDRAFLSVLDLSGRGALSAKAVAYYETDVVTILPPDDQGRPIVFVDRSRLPDELVHECNNQVRFEVTFLNLTKLLCTGAPRFLVVLFFTTKPRFFPATGSFFFDAVDFAFPLQLDAVLVTCRSPRTMYKQFMATTVPVILKIASRNCQRFNISIDVGEKEELLKKLLWHGMYREHLPHEVGGTWTDTRPATAARLQSLARTGTSNEEQCAIPVLPSSHESVATSATTLPSSDLSVGTYGISQEEAAAARAASSSSLDDGLQILLTAVEMDDLGVLPIDENTKRRPVMSTSTNTRTATATGTGSSNSTTSNSRNNNQTQHNAVAFNGGATHTYSTGTSTSTVTTGSGTATAVLQVSTPPATILDESLSNIPQQDQIAYLQAVLFAPPDLIPTEANVEAFVQVEHGNLNAAAQRMLAYWTVRRALFVDQADRPLAQSRDGALNGDDLRALKSGYLTLLPKNKKGRVVLCCDASRLESDSVESSLRCLMYMLRVAAEDASCQTNGIALLFVMNKLSFERSCRHGMMPQVLNVLPIKIASVHIVRQPARLGVQIFDEKVVPTLTKLLQPLNVPIQVHSGTLSVDLRKLLTQHDFDLPSLPRSLGGGWMYQDFQQWMSQRLQIESQIAARRAPQSVSTMSSSAPFSRSLNAGGGGTYAPLQRGHSQSQLASRPVPLYNPGFSMFRDDHGLGQTQLALSTAPADLAIMLRAARIDATHYPLVQPSLLNSARMVPAAMAGGNNGAVVQQQQSTAGNRPPSFNPALSIARAAPDASRDHSGRFRY